jgi:acyl carrier protein
MSLEKVKEIIVDELGCEPEEVTESTNIIEDLDADSLSVMQLVMTLEEEYDIEVPEEDIEKLVTVADILAYIESK